MDSDRLIGDRILRNNYRGERERERERESKEDTAEKENKERKKNKTEKIELYTLIN